MTQAIILAGGEGKRMAGTDGYALKSAVKIQGKTLLEWQLEQLERSGIKRVTIYTSEVTPQGVLDEYARSASNLGIDIDIKEKPLKIGSLGCVKDALLEMPADEDLVVLYGDIFSDINLGAMLERHQKSGFLATLAKIKGDHVPYGMIEDDSNGLITSFKEKGDLQYNSGIAVVKGEVCYRLLRVPPEINDFFMGVQNLHEAGLHAFGTYTHEGYWRDVKDMSVVAETEQAIREGKITLPSVGVIKGEGVPAGPSAEAK